VIELKATPSIPPYTMWPASNGTATLPQRAARILAERHDPRRAGSRIAQPTTHQPHP
jgi:hypothetical protein